MFALLSVLLLGIAAAEGAPSPSVLHFYQDYSLPVDARRMSVLADADIGVALGNSLITYNRDSQLEASLANRWNVDPNGRYVDFELRPEAKWSDGSAITAHDVVASFADGKKRFGHTYRSVYDAYETLEARGPRSVRFNLAKNVAPLEFIQRIVIPAFSIFKIENGRANMNVSSGAYSLQSADENEVILKVNKHHYQYVPAMFQEVHIRRSKGAFISVERLRVDPWPDMVYVPSMLGKSEMNRLPPGSQVWRRPDRLLMMGILDRRNLPASRAVISYLRAHADLEKVAATAYDARPARQIYASGVALHAEKDPAVQSMSAAELRRQWTKDQVEIVYDPSRIPDDVLVSLRQQLCGSLPLKCRFVPISVREFRRLREENKYDFVLTATSVDPVEPANSVSYIYEASPALIPSGRTAKENFSARVKAMRETGQGSLENFRTLLSDSVEAGYALPIFHTSTFIVGRSYMDFSLSETAVGNPDFQDLRRRP